MDQLIIPILVFTIIIVIILYNFFFSRIQKIKRHLKKASYSPIKAYRNGDISKIVGEVEPVGEPLKAPLSQRPCCYYYVKVERKVSSGKSSYWKTLIEDVKSSKFVINEDGHRAFIEGDHIEKYIVFDAKFNSGTFNDASSRLNQYLEQFGEESVSMLGFNKTLRYQEGILEVGEKIAVLGEGKWKDAHEPDLPESFGKVLYINSTQEMPIFLSDCTDTKEKIRFPEERKKELKKRYRK